MSKQSARPNQTPANKGERLLSEDGPLPPEINTIARDAKLRTDQARHLFKYALAMILVDQRKATIVQRETEEWHELVTLRGVTGNLYTVVRPRVSAATLEHAKVVARVILKLQKGYSDA